MSFDLRVQFSHSCSTWGTVQWLHRDLAQAPRGASAATCSAADHLYVDLATLAALTSAADQMDLPENKMPAFAQGAPLLTPLMWKAKFTQLLC